MSMNDHMEVREVIIFEWGEAPTITFNGIWKISKMYEMICAYDKGSETITVTIWDQISQRKEC
jgi:hypothetical protein